jgi:hypothetical protein
VVDPKLKKKILEQERKTRALEEPISTETIYLWNLYQLKMQGYPFQRDEIDIQTWYDFSIVESVINEIKNEQIKKHG